METKSVTIKKLFTAERRFLIPIFQRGYVWTRIGQWEPLWRDVFDQALIVRRELARPSKHVRRHFLGAIVIGEDENRLMRVSSSSVIDGQQRLTTLQVLLAALRDEVSPLNNHSLTRQLLRLTDNEGEWQNPDERFKIWPTNAYQDDFRRLMTSGSPEELATHYPQQRYRKKLIPTRPPLVDAYLYFTSVIGSYLRGANDWNEEVPSDAPKQEERALELLEAVQSFLQIVTIELGADDDPQVIFETLNARGVDLEPSDLIRNFVFLYAQRHDEDPNDLYSKYWKTFDETSIPGTSQKWWREKERQGRLFRERLDLFCFHYVTYRINREIKIGHLFQEFRDWWESGDAVFEESGDVDDETSSARIASVELSRFERLSHEFRGLITPDRTTRFGVFASRLKRLDTTTVYPLILWLAENRKDIPASELAAMLTDIESYLVRRAVCGLTNKNYNQIFLTLMRKLRRRGRPEHQALRSELASLSGESSLWPDDLRFGEALLYNPLYLQLGSAKTQMILEALEEASEDPRSERVIHGALSIEHVLPQSADPADWPYPADSSPTNEMSSGDQWAAVRQTLLHSLGNLTLLTQLLNSSVGKGPFSRKRPAITETSKLALNTYFQRLGDPQTWNERTIVERSRVLAGLACRVWPHPGPVSEVPNAA